MNNKGRVHIYYGDGKGKTTAGVGLCVRAAGAGFKVLVYQFLKDNSSCERNILKNIPGITLIDGRNHVKFTFNMSSEEKEEQKKYYMQMFQHIVCMAENYDVIFLDEILHVIHQGMLPELSVLNFLNHRPAGLEVILTGYNPSEQLIEAADYVSHIIKVKHPYDQRVAARRGIEK